MKPFDSDRLSTMQRLDFACPGKTRYATRKEAQATVVHMKRRRADKARSLNVYECLACGSFHVGNKPPERKKPR